MGRARLGAPLPTLIDQMGALGPCMFEAIWAQAGTCGPCQTRTGYGLLLLNWGIHGYVSPWPDPVHENFLMVSWIEPATLWHGCKNGHLAPVLWALAPVVTIESPFFLSLKSNLILDFSCN